MEKERRQMKRMLGVFVGCALCVLPLVANAGQNVVAASSTSTEKDKILAEEQKIEKALGVTPEQRQKMKELRQASQAKQKALADELKAKKSALREELEGPKPNRSKISGLVADVKALQGKMLDDRVEQIFQMREILTPEQYKKLKELRAERSSGDTGKKTMKEKIREKKGKSKK